MLLLQSPLVPPAWQVGGFPAQTWLAGHWELLMQDEPVGSCTVTEKVTAAPPPADCPVTSHGPPATFLVKR